MSKKTQIISTRLSFKDKKKGKFLILGIGVWMERKFSKVQFREKQME